MERVELLTHLEQIRRTRVAPDVRQTIFTVRQLVDAVMAAPAAGSDADANTAAPGATTPGDVEHTLAWETMLSEPPEAGLAANLSKRKAIRATVLFVLLRVCALVARVVPGFRVTGREHLPASGPFLICPNHQAYLDGFFLAAALPFRTFRQLFFVGAAEYFEGPLTSRLARAVNIVPVNPDAHLVNAMRAGGAGLRLGKVLILFPEGERSIDGDLKKFRKGAAILSSHLAAPIVPVAMDGLYDLWPRGRPFAWRRLLPGNSRPVTVRFGPPLRVDRGEYAGGTDALRAEVARLLGTPLAVAE
jgi:long-chain acyl-CoA synthetase